MSSLRRRRMTDPTRAPSVILRRNMAKARADPCCDVPVRRTRTQHRLPFGKPLGRPPLTEAERRERGSKVPHCRRVHDDARCPIHVTVRLREGLPSLRRVGAHRTLVAAFRESANQFGFRLVHDSIQSNHVHMIVEAGDRRALARGMQGLCIRVAKRLNKLWERKGKVFADRFHDRVLKTRKEVRHALAYVLNNARKHGVKLKQLLDPFTSGAWFDGWRSKGVARGAEAERPVARARTWLLKIGWRRWGLIQPTEKPG